MPRYPKPVEFFPMNKEKYKGSLPIIARSSWELKAFRFLDLNPNVIKWGSESVIVLYQDPTRPDRNGKPSTHRYFIDINMTLKEKNGSIQTYLVEIKPECKLIKPVQGKKKTSTFINESFDYIRNARKWKSAMEFAKTKGWKFLVFTESTINQM